MTRQDVKVLRRLQRRAAKAEEARQLAEKSEERDFSGSTEAVEEVSNKEETTPRDIKKSVPAERDEKKLGRFKEPRWSTGAASSTISFRPGGLVKAYKQLDINPRVDDETLWRNLMSAFSDAERSAAEGFNTKSRRGAILLIACSQSSNDIDDDFAILAQGIYLGESQKYLSTLSLPLPNSPSFDTPSVRLEMVRPIDGPTQSQQGASEQRDGDDDTDLVADMMKDFSNLRGEIATLQELSTKLVEQRVKEKEDRGAREDGIRGESAGLISGLKKTLTTLKQKEKQTSINLEATRKELETKTIDLEETRKKLLSTKQALAEAEEPKVSKPSTTMDHGSYKRMVQLELENQTLTESLRVAREKLKTLTDQVALQPEVTISTPSPRPIFVGTSASRPELGQDAIDELATHAASQPVDGAIECPELPPSPPRLETLVKLDQTQSDKNSLILAKARRDLLKEKARAAKEMNAKEFIEKQLREEIASLKFHEDTSARLNRDIATESHVTVPQIEIETLEPKLRFESPILAQVKEAINQQSLVTKELAEEVARLKATVLKPTASSSINDKKDFVIKNLSEKVIELSRQVKEQNEQYVKAFFPSLEILTILGGSTS